MRSLKFCFSISGWSLFLFFSPALLAQSNGPTKDYREIFGQDYDNALEIIEENIWWSDSLEKDGIEPDFALSIVFPELIRYSSIADYIEVKGLEVLYVQYGQDYADFSMGLFQMKPSFAERIESDIIQYRLTDKFPSLSSLNPKATDNVETRKERIIRLKDKYHQLLYLEAFIRIMDTINPDLVNAKAKDRLSFYSTAYNTGYFKDEQVIRDEMTRKRFYRGMEAASDKYSYSDISLDYYVSVDK